MTNLKYILVTMLFFGWSCNDGFWINFRSILLLMARTGNQKISCGLLFILVTKDFSLNWLLTPPVSLGDDVVWGALSSGLSKVPGGRHTALDGFPFSSFWNYTYSHILHAIIFWIITILLKYHRLKRTSMRPK